jgi:hypothetical protein
MYLGFSYLHLIALAVTILAATHAAAYDFVSPPLGSTQGGYWVRIYSEQSYGCTSPDDCAIHVLFDGIESPKLAGMGGLYALAPPHPKEGAVPITIVTPFRRIEITGQFAYVVDQTRVLFPLFMIPSLGAAGSLWATELWVHNGGNEDVALGSVWCVDQSGVAPCHTPPDVVAAGATRRIAPRWENYESWGAAGRFLGIRTEALDSLTFDLRLRDLNHPAAGEVSIPVVPPSRLRAQVTLMNVPTGGNTRKLLRIYSASCRPQTNYKATIVDPDTGTPVTFTILTVNIPTESDPTLAFVARDSGLLDRPEVARIPRVNLEITPINDSCTLFWPLLSITDNSTGQVLLISPQP